MTKEKQQWLITSINSSPDLPESFYGTYKKYFPNALTQGVWGSIFNQVIGGRRDQCSCREIYIHPGYTYKWNRFAQEIIAFEIEEHCSNKKCFEFNMSISDFGMNTKGIINACHQYYNKEVDQLTEREIIELILIQKGPTSYNPILNKKDLDRKVNEIMNGNKN